MGETLRQMGRAAVILMSVFVCLKAGVGMVQSIRESDMAELETRIRGQEMAIDSYRASIDALRRALERQTEDADSAGATIDLDRPGAVNLVQSNADGASSNIVQFNGSGGTVIGVQNNSMGLQVGGGVQVNVDHGGQVTATGALRLSDGAGDDQVLFYVNGKAVTYQKSDDSRDP